RKAAAAGGARSITYVPLIDQHEGIGTIIFGHPQAGFKFSHKQVALARTFADQAVIAIQNTRLFNETQEALERQTATSNVLQVISASPGELKPVFQALLENATRVCGANFGTMNLYDGDRFENVALHNVPPAFAELRKNRRFRANPLGGLGTTIRTKQVAHTRD